MQPIYLHLRALALLQELKEQEMMDEQRRRQMEEENYRLEREAEERERQRRLEEHRDIQKKVAKERIEQLKSTTLGARALATYSEEVCVYTGFVNSTLDITYHNIFVTACCQVILNFV